MSTTSDPEKCPLHEEVRILTPSQHNPQRLSALYQYHNAPELAPVSGLEYDDTIHSASSDKYPVVHPRQYESRHVGKIYDNDRPPRIIFGMKVRTFLMVAAILLLLVVGAAVGGALGGARRENHVQPNYSPAEIETNGGSSSASRYTKRTLFSRPRITDDAYIVHHPLHPRHQAQSAISLQYLHTHRWTPAQLRTTLSTHHHWRTGNRIQLPRKLA